MDINTVSLTESVIRGNLQEVPPQKNTFKTRPIKAK